MPAPRMMQAKDVAGYLGISLRSAGYKMNMFEAMGMTITTNRRVTAADWARGKSKQRPGRARRLIDVRKFAAWMCEQDGVDLEERVHDLQSFLAVSRREEADRVRARRYGNGSGRACEDDDRAVSVL